VAQNCSAIQGLGFSIRKPGSEDDHRIAFGRTPGERMGLERRIHDIFFFGGRGLRGRLLLRFWRKSDLNGLPGLLQVRSGAECKDQVLGSEESLAQGLEPEK
jgi:hypothetical protein